MRLHHFLIPLLALTTGCAASTYPLNPQLAAEVGLPPGGVSISEVADTGDAKTPYLQKGACSWYGPGFHGRRTSNGEVFDKNALTAAHPTLPFGTQVEVKDVRSGKKVRVRINDRGPYAHHRILDLSYAAANQLGVVNSGVANVELRLVDIDERVWPDEAWALQVGTFENKIDAEHFIEGLTPNQRTAGLVYVKGPDDEATRYSVRFGPFNCEKTAKTAKSKLERVGLRPSITKEDLSRAEQTASAAAR
jgi:rare lipoprotein A